MTKYVISAVLGVLVGFAALYGGVDGFKKWYFEKKRQECLKCLQTIVDHTATTPILEMKKCSDLCNTVVEVLDGTRK